MPDIPGGTVTWNLDVTWPSPPTRTGSDHENSESLYLHVPVRDFSSDPSDSITLDEEGARVPPGSKCVVLGVTRNEMDCYVLVVAKSGIAGGDKPSWERIGVGKVARGFVAWENVSSWGVIC